MEHRVDVSALEPPEPFERILDALMDLPRGDLLRVRHRREPFPLYRLLERSGFRWRTERHGDEVDILIWPESPAAPQGAPGKTC